MMKLTSFDIENLYDLPCQVFWKDKKGIYRGCNEYASLILKGPTAADFIGSHDNDLLTPKAASTLINNDKQVILQKNPLTIIEDADFLDSTKFEKYAVLSFKQPLYAAKDKIIGLIGFSFIINHKQTLPLSFINPHMPISHPMLDRFKQQPRQKPEQEQALTPRQAEVVFHLVQGKTAKQIATIFNLSSRTIEHHIQAIKVKYQCHSKSELIALALKMNFIQQKLARAI